MPVAIKVRVNREDLLHYAGGNGDGSKQLPVGGQQRIAMNFIEPLNGQQHVLSEGFHARGHQTRGSAEDVANPVLSMTQARKVVASIVTGIVFETRGNQLMKQAEMDFPRVRRENRRIELPVR